MKFLIITPVVPYPPHRGDKLHIFNVIKELNLHYELKILTICRSKEDLKDLNKLRLLGYKIEYVYQSQWRRKLNVLRTLFFLEPTQIALNYSKKMEKLIKKELCSTKYGSIFIHLITMARYIDLVKDEKFIKINDITDAMSLYLSRYVEAIENPLKKLFFHFELSRIKSYERKLKKFDMILACSNVDIDFLLERKIHHNIKLFPNGFDFDKLDALNINYQEKRIMFSGNLPYFPNTDAVFYFVNEIFPLILKSEPQAQFYIVGKDPSDEIKALASKNIIVTGFVDDINKEYMLSEVNVAPIRFGSGTLNKIIEALALGVPTVATRFSVAGFPDEVKKYIYVADSAQEFADSVIRIMNDKSIRTTQLELAKQVVQNKFSMKNIIGELVTNIEMLKK